MYDILTIDDDVHINTLPGEVLTNEGHTVHKAFSGTEALLPLSRSRPALVLLDLMPPGLSGEGSLPQIKDIPGIIVGQTLKMPLEAYQYPVIDGEAIQIYGEDPRYPKGAYRIFLEYFYDHLPSGQAWQFNTMTAENLPGMAISSCIILLLSF